MATASTLQRHEPEELLSRSKDRPQIELIDGQFVEKPSMGAQADRILTRLVAEIEQFAKIRGLGQTFTGGCGYQIFRDDPSRVRYPDGSFVRAGRLPGEAAPPGHMKIPPDLAIEVVSPNDNAENVEERVGDLLGAGVRVLLVIYPISRRIYIHQPDQPAGKLAVGELLSFEDVLPGFTIPVASLFDPV